MEVQVSLFLLCLWICSPRSIKDGSRVILEANNIWGNICFDLVFLYAGGGKNTVTQSLPMVQPFSSFFPTFARRSKREREVRREGGKARETNQCKNTVIWRVLLQLIPNLLIQSVNKYGGVEKDGD